MHRFQHLYDLCNQCSSISTCQFVRHTQPINSDLSVVFFRQIKMTNLGDQLEKVQISDEPAKRRPLNARNDGIPDELKESARKFDQHFQDLELREETRYRVSNYSSNLFTKNAETSQKYRKMGNELYSSQRYEESLNSYNQVGFSRNAIQCMALHLNAIHLNLYTLAIHLNPNTPAILRWPLEVSKNFFFIIARLKFNSLTDC